MFAKMRAKRQLENLIGSWREYHDIVIRAIETPQFASKDEEKYLNIKVRLATQLQAVADTVPSSVFTEYHETSAAIADLLKSQSCVKIEDSQMVWDRDQFERIWQDYYIQLSKLKGVSLEPKPSVKARTPSAVPTGFGKPRGYRRRFNFRPLRVAFGIVCLALMLYAVGYSLGVRIDGQGHFSVENQTALGKAAQGSLNTFDALGRDFLKFFAPVFDAYGPDLATVLFAIVLFMTGVMVFVRT